MANRLPICVLALSGLALLGVRPLAAQTSADTAGIRTAAMDYIEGWYAGDAARMERAVHPELVKLAKWNGRWVIVNVLWENKPKPS